MFTVFCRRSLASQHLLRATVPRQGVCWASTVTGHFGATERPSPTQVLRSETPSILKLCLDPSSSGKNRPLNFWIDLSKYMIQDEFESKKLLKNIKERASDGLTLFGVYPKASFSWIAVPPETMLYFVDDAGDTVVIDSERTLELFLQTRSSRSSMHDVKILASPKSAMGLE